MLNPCKGCVDRHLYCHSKCCKYKVWKAHNDKIKTAIREAADDYGASSCAKTQHNALSKFRNK